METNKELEDKIKILRDLQKSLITQMDLLVEGKLDLKTAGAFVDSADKAVKELKMDFQDLKNQSQLKIRKDELGDL